MLNNLKRSSKRIVDNMEYVKNQSLKGISWYEPMVSTKYAALIITPGFDQYNAPLKQMVLVYQIINLLKKEKGTQSSKLIKRYIYHNVFNKALYNLHL